MGKKMRRRRRAWVWVLVLIMLAALIGWSAADQRNIDVSRFSVSGAPEAFSGFKIAQISDLHNAEFGKDNQRLIEILEQETPDMIVFTGDFVDAWRTNADSAAEFARQCAAIADCYFVTGNHEAQIGERYAALESALVDAGVTVLRNASVRIRRGIDSIRLIGVDDPAFGGDLGATLEALSTDDYAVLLAHRPEQIGEYAKWGMDLVLSGHAHGGQIRIPGIGGVYAPGQGFFPKYSEGAYTVDGATMIVSRGLGNSVLPLRVNDRPELVIVTLNN